MKKKISDKDKKDWIAFVNSKSKLHNKDKNEKNEKIFSNEESIDLHGYPLSEANKVIHNFILSCYKKNVYKINRTYREY